MDKTDLSQDPAVQMTGHLIKSLNIFNPQYPPWITSCLSEGAGVPLITISGDFKGHSCPWATLGTATWAFQCLRSYGSGSVTHDKLFPMPYQLILSVSLNETWGKCDSLSFLGNDRFAKRGPGECLPCVAQLGSMRSRLLPSLPFPSTFKISIATFLLTAKTRRDFLVSSVAFT